MLLRGPQRLVVALLATFLLLTASPANASDRFDVYFVAIGSARYAEAPTLDLHGFGDILGAGKSARTTADILSMGGASFGIVLTSVPGKFVSRRDIDDALDAIELRIASDRPKHPLLVFYFAGHGLGEGVGWNLFAIPGDIVLKGDPQRLSLENFSHATLHAATLVDRLEKLNIPFLVFFDNCYEGTAQNFRNFALSEQNSQNFLDIVAGLKTLNQFPDSDPVLFSAAVGATVPTVPDPRDEQSDYLAPLARRLLLFSQKNLGTVTLGQLVDGLRNPSLDSETSAPITFSKRTPLWDGELLRAAAPTGVVERRQGSATGPTPCCDPPFTAPEMQQRLSGTVDLFGAPGDFISDGATLSLSNGAIAIEPENHNIIRLEIAAPDGVWMIQLAGPDSSALSIATFSNAKRWPFQDEHEPGLAIDAPGRSCNTVDGSFEILELLRSENRIERLSFLAEQRCDDNPAKLRVRVKLGAF